MGQQSNSDNVLVGLATPEEVAKHWQSHILPMLIKSDFEGMDPRISNTDILELLLKGYLNLIAVVVDSRIDALAIVYCAQEFRCKSGYVLLVCGTGLLRWGEKLIEYMRSWFRANGCDYAQYTSQPGWKRWDPQSKPIGTVYLTKL